MIDLRDKKILVTGGAGFLGAHVVRELKKRGVPEDRILTPHAAETDLRKWDNCVKVVRGVDVVVNLAAKVGGISYNQEKPGELFYDNIIMGVHMIEAARQGGVKKFVQIGTICSYPKFTPAPFREESLWDGYPEETNAPFGLAKKALLIQIQAYRDQYQFPGINLLCVNLYGPGDTFEPGRSHAIPGIIKKIVDAKERGESSVTLLGTGTPTREFIYVEDAAEAIVLATERYDGAEPVNIGSGKEISIKNLAETVAEILGFKGDVRWDATKPDGQPRRLLDVSRAEREFGFRAKTDFYTGLKNLVEWYKANKNVAEHRNVLS